MFQTFSPQMKVGSQGEDFLFHSFWMKKKLNETSTLKANFHLLLKLITHDFVLMVFKI